MEIRNGICRYCAAGAANAISTICWYCEGKMGLDAHHVYVALGEKDW